MKKLNENKFQNFEIKNPCNIRGGDGKTTYKLPNGKTGKDCYSDDDGDGKLSKGDGILLDSGKWITMSLTSIQ